MSYSIDSLTADCYAGTTCLINKLNIHDEDQLTAVGAGITMMKDSELSEYPIQGKFDFAHNKAIHRYLFEDLYAWAGETRTVDMAKKGTSFVKAEDIDRVAESAFRRLRAKQFFTDIPFDEFVKSIVDFYGVINMLHPFREGNDRTQRVFFSQLIHNTGYDIDFAKIDPDELMVATIQAASGVEDGLRNIFGKAICSYLYSSLESY